MFVKSLKTNNNARNNTCIKKECVRDMLKNLNNKAMYLTMCIKLERKVVRRNGEFASHMSKTAHGRSAKSSLPLNMNH